MVDEDGDGVDMHVVQPLDGVGDDQRQCGSAGGGEGAGQGRAGPPGTQPSATEGPTPHPTLPGLALPVNKSGCT